MEYIKIKDLNDKNFRRITGIDRLTFDKIVEILKEKDDRKKEKGGRNSKLTIENKLLMTLEFLKENKTYFHIGKIYGASESSAHRIIKWVEDSLAENSEFSLSSRKFLLIGAKKI